MKRWVLLAGCAISCATAVAAAPHWVVSVGRDGAGYTKTDVSAASYKFLPLQGWTCTLTSEAITDASLAIEGRTHQRLLICESGAALWSQTLSCPLKGSQWWETQLIYGPARNAMNLQVGCKVE